MQNKRNPFGMEKKQEELKHLTELVLGIKIRTPKDFELLQKEIQQKTGQQLRPVYAKAFLGLCGQGQRGLQSASDHARHSCTICRIP